MCVCVVVERGTCIALLQSHVEWRENSWLVSVYSVVPGANLKGLCDVLLLFTLTYSLHTHRHLIPFTPIDVQCGKLVCPQESVNLA